MALAAVQVQVLGPGQLGKLPDKAPAGKSKLGTGAAHGTEAHSMNYALVALPPPTIEVGFRQSLKRPAIF